MCFIHPTQPMVLCSRIATQSSTHAYVYWKARSEHCGDWRAKQFGRCDHRARSLEITAITRIPSVDIPVCRIATVAAKSTVMPSREATNAHATTTVDNRHGVVENVDMGVSQACQTGAHAISG
jgi:hypothetical protein